MGLTICAARAAVCAAIAAGEQEISAVAIATDLAEPAPPCGACRQVLAQFAPKRGALLVVMAGRGRALRTTTLAALLPEPFTFTDVARGRG